MLKVPRSLATAFEKSGRTSVQTRHTLKSRSLHSHSHSPSPFFYNAYASTSSTIHIPKTLSHHCLTSPSLSPSSRAFHATPRASDFHFDTHHFVQRLEREGLNRAQAEGIMSAMAEVIDESIRNMTSNMVTKADQEKVCSST